MKTKPHSSHSPVGGSDRQRIIGPRPAVSVSGIVAHQSAMKDGALLKIPQHKL